MRFEPTPARCVLMGNSGRSRACIFGTSLLAKSGSGYFATPPVYQDSSTRSSEPAGEHAGHAFHKVQGEFLVIFGQLIEGLARQYVKLGIADHHGVGRA